MHVAHRIFESNSRELLVNPRPIVGDVEWHGFVKQVKIMQQPHGAAADAAAAVEKDITSLHPPAHHAPIDAMQSIACSPDRRWQIIGGFTIFIATIICYWPALHGDFI